MQEGFTIPFIPSSRSIRRAWDWQIVIRVILEKVNHVEVFVFFPLPWTGGGGSGGTVVARRKGRVIIVLRVVSGSSVVRTVAGRGSSATPSTVSRCCTLSWRACRTQTALVGGIDHQSGGGRGSPARRRVECLVFFFFFCIAYPFQDGKRIPNRGERRRRRIITVTTEPVSIEGAQVVFVLTCGGLPCPHHRLFMERFCRERVDSDSTRSRILH